MRIEIMLVLVFCLLACEVKEDRMTWFTNQTWKQVTKEEKGFNCLKIIEFDNERNIMIFNQSCSEIDTNYHFEATFALYDEGFYSDFQFHGIPKKDSLTLIFLNDSLAFFYRNSKKDYIIFEKLN